MGPFGHSLAFFSALAAAPFALAGLGLFPRWRVGLSERLGAREAVPSESIWVHGASVGEIHSSIRLLDVLRAVNEEVVASAMTVTGRDLLRQLRSEIPCALAPFDHPWTTQRALRIIRPSALVFVETEIWPSWIYSAHSADIPIVVVSGRISDRSYDRYLQFRNLLRPFLQKITGVGARSEVDAERFRNLGVTEDRIKITGDLKLCPPGRLPELPLELAQQFGSLPIIVAGSTHEGEEDAVLDAFDFIKSAGCQAGLVLAPRHPERFSEVAKRVSNGGRNLIRRTMSNRPLMAGDVMLLDSLGELPAVFGRANVAFVGGSMVPKGGHNILEPIYFGHAVIFGSYIEHIREMVQLVLSSGGGVQIANRHELRDVFLSALTDTAAWAMRGDAARKILAAHLGAARCTADFVLETRESVR